IGAMVDYFTAAFWLQELRTREGLRKWVGRCRDLGITRLYFRVSVHGDFLHHTRIERRLSAALAEDYLDADKKKAMLETCEAARSFDMLAAVTEDAHRLGMEVVPWITLSDEGIPEVSYTEFASTHPEFLMQDREGKRYDRSLSFGYAEVRAYRIALIRELQEYGTDGVFLDFTRWLWKSHVQARGCSLVDDKSACLLGYDDPVIQEYREKTGRDPYEIPNGDTDWVRFRAEATNTQFLRELRLALPGYPLYAYFLPRGFLSEMLLDVPGWIKEGLVDALCPCAVTDVPQEGRIGRWTYALWNDFARQFGQMVRAHRGTCRVGAPILVSYSYGPHPDFVGTEPWSFLRPEIVEDVMLSAVRGGADELIFYDLCQEYNGERELWESLKPICRRALS
ncbi:MAG: family 10 glycosylhydrolase, partial [Candidatus Latescibacteria bacterium]|nr:family 10 glycosylhydrolase [Candidatus Latescibacterota bacterium]